MLVFLPSIAPTTMNKHIQQDDRRSNVGQQVMCIPNTVPVLVAPVCQRFCSSQLPVHSTGVPG